MAKLKEEVLIIKISTLLPDNIDIPDITNNDNIQELVQVIEQLAGTNKTLVEVERIAS